MANKKEKKSGKILIVASFLIILLIASFGGMYVFMNSKNKDEAKKVVQTYQDLGEFMVNLDDDGRSRYIKVHLNVGFNSEDKEAKKILENNVVLLRDSAIFYLKSKKADDFKAGNEENLKKGLKSELNKNLDDPYILDVYMTDIIVQ